jgi:hypothetical protein
LPHQTDIDKVSDEEIQDIVIAANLTPRKCLGKTPFQAILKQLGKDDANSVCIALLHLALESRLAAAAASMPRQQAGHMKPTARILSAKRRLTSERKG